MNLLTSSEIRYIFLLLLFGVLLLSSERESGHEQHKLGNEN